VVIESEVPPMLFEINLDPYCEEAKLFWEPVDRMCTKVSEEFNGWVDMMWNFTIVLVSY
jgi:hypothetical protein